MVRLSGIRTRLVEKDYSEKEGINYFETFSLVHNMDTIKLVLYLTITFH